MSWPDARLDRMTYVGPCTTARRIEVALQAVSDSWQNWAHVTRAEDHLRGNAGIRHVSRRGLLQRLSMQPLHCPARRALAGSPKAVGYRTAVRLQDVRKARRRCSARLPRCKTTASQFEQAQLSGAHVSALMNPLNLLDHVQTTVRGYPNFQAPMGAPLPLGGLWHG